MPKIISIVLIWIFNLDKEGNANITEKWDVKGSDGTEWFKQITNLGESQISNFTVLMDGTPLTYKEWNIKESLNEKKGYYSINKIDNGIELYFGKSDYERHLLTLNYQMSNFIFNTVDSKVLVWRIINTPDINFENFKITVRSYYRFSDTLDVW